MLRRPASAWRPLWARCLGSWPAHSVVGLPALSPTMETGRISEWLVSAGDAFSAGDVICEVETDKATVAFEAQDEGFLAKVLVQAGEGEVKVGDPICLTSEDAPDLAAFDSFTLEDAGASSDSSSDSSSSSSSSEAEQASTPAATPGERTVTEAFLLSPAARHFAQSKGVDVSGLQGTGKAGRITKADIVLATKAGTQFPPLAAAAAAADPSAAPAPSAQPFRLADVRKTDAPYTDTPASSMRKVIAKRLTASKSEVPHLYAAASCDLSPLLALRQALVASQDTKISVNDVVIRCAALALRDVPAVNRLWDARAEEPVPAPGVDISVAVATPNGLITPIVPRADATGLWGIAQKVRDLAGRAREGKLKPEEYQGGSFTISNLGMFGISEFSAVINPPQAAILAVGGGQPTMVPTAEGTLEEKSFMTVQLSADRRVVDEAAAAEYLQVFKGYVEAPEALLL